MKKKVVIFGCGYLGYNIATLFDGNYNVKLWGLVSPYSFSSLFEEVDAFNLTKEQFKWLNEAIVIDAMSLFPFNLEVDDEAVFMQDFLNKYRGFYQTLREAKIQQYIYLSSGGTVYGNCAHACDEDSPLNGMTLNLYSRSKIYLEKVIAQMNLPYTIIRLSNPFGGYQLTNRKQGVIPVLIESALYQKDFHCWNTLESRRDYIYISDLAHALTLLIDLHKVNQIYNVGSGHSVSLKTIIDTVEEVSGASVPLVMESVDPNIVSDSLLNIDKFKKDTCFKPLVSLKQGILEEVKRIKENH